MAEAFFLVPMAVRDERARVIEIEPGQIGTINNGWVRYCSIVNYLPQILANGGTVSRHFAEIGAGWAVVKVAGPQAGLDFLANRPGFSKFPQRRLSILLSSLTLAERNELREIATAVEFTAEQIADVSGATTYGEALKRLLRRRRRPLEYDEVLGEYAYEPHDWINIGGFLGNRTLGSLTSNQRQALRDEALAMERTQEEIEAFIGIGTNWGGIRLNEVLGFMSHNWTRPLRWAMLASIFGKAENDIQFSNISIAELDAEVTG